MRRSAKLWLPCLSTILLLPATAAEGPWAEKPVVFSQELGAATSATNADVWAHWRGLGRHPSGISAVEKGAAPVRYSGLWQKNPKVLGWASYRDMSEEDYQETWQVLYDRGFRVVDLDAHVVGGVPYYDAIWIKEAQPKLFFSHRALTLGELDAKILLYRAQGFRPIKVNAYRLGSNQLRFAAVWVRDGQLDFKVERDLTDAQYTARWTAYRAEGYAHLDIACYPGSSQNGNQLRFAGIWLRDAAFEERTIGGALRFSAIWTRLRDGVIAASIGHLVTLR
jgi:hypothetical protein